LVLLTKVLVFAFRGFSADLFVVLLQSSKIFTRFRKFTFFHTFTHVPVNKGALGVHQVELVVDAREHFSDGRRVRDHAHGTLHASKITAWYNSWRLVVDTALETRWAPVHELDRALGLDRGNRSIHILWHDITTVHETRGHVLAVAWVTLGHHRGWFKDAVGDFSDRQLLVVRLLSRDHWRVRAQHEVDTWVWHQVGLEFRDINVQRTIETERRGERRDDLRNQTVQVGVRWAFNVERAATDIVDGFVVEHHSDIRVFQERVSREHRVIWLNDSRRHLWRRIDREAKLTLAAVVDRQTFEQKRAETRTSTTTDGVEHHEALETGTVIGELADAVKHQVYNFLANRVVATRVVVGRIFLARDNLLWVVELTVRARAHFVTHGRLEIHKHGAWHVLSSAGL
uniref:Secreted protein n=1 Tax=Globisporangium ultimum (strain ATCC 200006 / CBS 805.95 / DAOM BR144) TaxID=431595 RepID=K3X1R8_GLOUD